MVSAIGMTLEVLTDARPKMLKQTSRETVVLKTSQARVNRGTGDDMVQHC